MWGFFNILVKYEERLKINYLSIKFKKVKSKQGKSKKEYTNNKTKIK